MRVRFENSSTILGVPVNVIDEDALLADLTECVLVRKPTVFVGLYAALFRRLQLDDDYRALVLRSVTYPDGFGVVRELRKRGIKDAMRVATTDAVHPIARLAAQNGWRVGLYGAAPGVAERAANALVATAPAISVVEVRDGFSTAPTVEEVSRWQVDVLLVAIGAGEQERWAHEVAVAAGVPAIITCGGLFDFLAGDKRRAPDWMQQVGLEWVFRTVLEPKRLISRYVIGNANFLRRARIERQRAFASTHRT